MFAGESCKVLVGIGVVFADFFDDVLADVGVVFLDLFSAAKNKNLVCGMLDGSRTYTLS